MNCIIRKLIIFYVRIPLKDSAAIFVKKRFNCKSLPNLCRHSKINWDDRRNNN